MPGPFFKMRLRLAVREKLEEENPSLTRRQVRARMDEVTGKFIDKAVKDAGAAEAVFALENGVGAIGDGEFLKRILDFFKSDLGQALTSRKFTAHNHRA